LLHVSTLNLCLFYFAERIFQFKTKEKEENWKKKIFLLHRLPLIKHFVRGQDTATFFMTLLVFIAFCTLPFFELEEGEQKFLFT
jgi:type II secretory pathway component PulF